jgi:hypothetical protein
MQTKPITEANYTISDGDAGIYETVDYMWNYALRDAKDPLLVRLVADLRSKSKLATIKNIYDWVWKNVRYENDPPDREMITAPIHFVNGNRKTGDCDCMTTLLVCLLEAAGYEAAITVIAWRLEDYTHVFAEVKHDGKWFILDPTLKRDGFGQQDKKIRRYKRITKKDMQKLRVLADDTDLASVQNEERPLRRIGKCRDSRAVGRNRDDNKNVNNININFGTNVENSHNPSSYRSNSRQVGASELPQLTPSYELKTQSQQVNIPIVLKPEVSTNGVKFVREDEVIATELPSTSLITRVSGDSVYYIKDNTPSYVPPYRDRGKGYIEFP